MKSDQVKTGMQQAPHRSLFNALGFTDEEMKKPMVGNISMDEEGNVNGSYAAIEGITSPDGRCLGKMAHVERRGDSVAVNIYGDQDLKIFESGVLYFK